MAIQTAFDVMPRVHTTGVFDTIFAQLGNFTFILPSGPGTLATTANIATETSRATAAEATVSTAVETETTARIAADGVNAAAISAETTARIAADAAEVTARNTAIGVETARATAAEAANAAAVTTEATARAAADTTNATAITTEATARASAVSGEATVRIAGDATEAAARMAAIAAQATVPHPGLLFGLTLSNDSGTPNTVLDIAAGTCADSANAVTVTLGAFTKSVAGSWAAGSGGNGMGTGLTATAATWYHVFAIIVSGSADVYFDTSVTAANKPASTTAFRRIGSIDLDGSVHIVPFGQNGDRFDRGTPLQEYNGTPGVTTAVSLTLNATPPGVPVQALLSGGILDSAANGYMYLSSLAQADVAASGAAQSVTNGASAGGAASLSATVLTNASQQIRRRVSAATTTANIITNGYIDTRGRG